MAYFPPAPQFTTPTLDEVVTAGGTTSLRIYVAGVDFGGSAVSIVPVSSNATAVQLSSVGGNTNLITITPSSGFSPTTAVMDLSGIASITGGIDLTDDVNIDGSLTVGGSVSSPLNLQLQAGNGYEVVTVVNNLVSNVIDDGAANVTINGALTFNGVNLNTGGNGITLGLSLSYFQTDSGMVIDDGYSNMTVGTITGNGAGLSGINPANVGGVEYDNMYEEIVGLTSTVSNIFSELGSVASVAGNALPTSGGTMQGNIDLQAYSLDNVSNIYSADTGLIIWDFSGNNLQWNAGTLIIGGVLEFPDSSTQTTAWTGEIDGSAITSGTIAVVGYSATQQTLTDATSIAWNMANGANAVVTLGGNRTLANPSNLVSGTYYLIVVKQPATGGPYTLGYGSSYIFPNGVKPVLSTAASAKDLITFYYDGAKLYGVAQKAFS